jgi:hypothetical protein
MPAHDPASQTGSTRPVNAPDATPGDRGIRRKPLDNPARPKSTYSSDEGCARLLGQLLRQVPSHLAIDRSSPFPLLAALIALDTSRGTTVGREIIFVAAVNHRTADERRTAEYLLRNRHDVVDGRRSAKSLLMAARWAAELDVRRDRFSESSLPRSLAAPSIADLAARAAAPSAGEIVLDALRSIAGSMYLTSALESQIVSAVTIAVDLAMRHARNRGKGSALLAMRTDARTEARLVTHLRREFGNDAVARNLARLLVGPDRASIETALLWWSLRRNPEAVAPQGIRDRWTRYVRGAEVAASSQRALSLANASVPKCDINVDAGPQNSLQSGISDGRAA